MYNEEKWQIEEKRIDEMTENENSSEENR